jgi:hypothetical protein
MMLTLSDRTPPHLCASCTGSKPLFALVAGLLGWCMRVEAVAEVPRLAVNMRVVPGKHSHMPSPSMREE